MSTDSNCRNLEHRQFFPLPTAEELRVLEKVLDHCLHQQWSREYDRDGFGRVVCDICGASVEIGSNRQSDYSEPDSLLSDLAINEMLLRELPRPAGVEIVANQVLRKIESAGWECIVFHRGAYYFCSMAKGAERYSSGRQTTRSKAIVAAAAQIAVGKFPR